MKKSKYNVEFYFGVRPVKTFDLYIAAIFLSLGVNLVNKFTKADKENLWAIIDEVGKQYHIRVINALILSVPELLSGRIDREIDGAIADYNDMVESPEPEITPIFSEEKDGTTPLGGEMRLRAPWLKNKD